MLGLHRRLPVFQPPPCMCAEIEEHVREAIAMRDEMAKWDTPLREWAKLQEMPVLNLKPKDELVIGPSAPVPLFDYGYTHMRVSTCAQMPIVRAPMPAEPLYVLGLGEPDIDPEFLAAYTQPTPKPKPMARGSFRLQLLPGENYEIGTILARGSGAYERRYKITHRLFDNTNCVLVQEL